MNLMRTRCAPVVVALALAGCGASSPGMSMSPSPGMSTSPSPAASPAASGSTGNVTPSLEIVTPKPGNPTPAATASPAGGSVLSGDLVDLLAVRCDADGLELGSDRVRAASDGVHFRVTGEPGYQVGFEHELGGGGFEIDLGAPDRVELVPPGAMTISCGPTASPAAAMATAVTIEDPDGVYRPYAIGLGAHWCMSADALYAEGATGSKVLPVEQAKAGLVGLSPGDIVQRGGYPVEAGRVRVVRNGEVIGTLDYQPDGNGGWLLVGSTLCDGLGMGREP